MRAILGLFLLGALCGCATSPGSETMIDTSTGRQEKLHAQAPPQPPLTAPLGAD